MKFAALIAIIAMACIVAVEARSVAQIKAAILQAPSSQPQLVANAPVGTPLSTLQNFSSKKVSEVKPEGIGAQLPGDADNNEAAIKAVKFDLRWAKSIKEAHLTEAKEVVPKVDLTNERFLDFQAKNTRQPLIPGHLFNS